MKTKHINTTDEAIYFEITLAGETRVVEFKKYSPESTDARHVERTIAAQVGQGVKRWRADVRCKLNSNGEYHFSVIANGKIGGSVKAVGWVDQFEGTAIGNKQNNRYKI